MPDHRLPPGEICSIMKDPLWRFLFILFPLFHCGLSSAQDDLVEISQDFSRDPGWDNYQNRIVGTDMPTVIQGFGRTIAAPA